MTEQFPPSGDDKSEERRPGVTSENKPRVRAATPAGVMRRASDSSTTDPTPLHPTSNVRRVPPVPPRTEEPVDASLDAKTDAVSETADENVGKIRDILFGGQMKEYETRFRNLEDHLNRESERMREDTERRFVRLESYIREEFGKLSSRIQHESTERLSSSVEFEKNIAAAESQMTTLVKSLDSELKRDHQEVRRNLYEQGLELEEKLRVAQRELSSTMQTHSRQLQDDKLGRDMLAGLLDDLAVRLRGEND